jgi:hypothetical protein
MWQLLRFAACTVKCIVQTGQNIRMLSSIGETLFYGVSACWLVLGSGFSAGIVLYCIVSHLN